MLIRVSGGVGGVAEYLRGGRKQGRDVEREQLDERVVLAGNLGITEAIIDGMTGEGERYLHITLAFREDEVSAELLAEVTREFEVFAMSAYEKDEYCFYAEAHLPRIKSYTDQGSGDFVERKLHIHVVIPEVNLLSGQRLDPFGRVGHNSAYIDAFQEHINHRFGLASPKLHRRTGFTDQSEIIGRHKGDLFTGSSRSGRELKAQLLDALLQERVATSADFQARLAEFGQVTVRNAGKANEYFNLKPAGQSKGINLKEYVFSREFIELPVADKHARMVEELSHTFETAGPSEPTPDALEAKLGEWYSIRAREIKYINSGNRKLWRRYQEAGPEERQALLADRATRFYARHRKENHHDQQRRNRPQRVRGKDRQPDLGAIAEGTPPQSLHRLRNLSEVGLVGAAQGGEVLLPADAPGQLDLERPVNGGESMRRGADDGGGDERGAVVQGAADGAGLPSDRDSDRRLDRRSDSVLGQLARDRRHAHQLEGSAATPEFVDIKRHLDAQRLLDNLATSHGLIVEKYVVAPGKDGGDRIRCGTRHLNVSDFLTKEMRLSWTDAAVILRETYAQQQRREPHRQSIPQSKPPRRQLWAEFQAWRKLAALDRAAARSAQRASERVRREALRDRFKVERTAIYADRRGRPADRKAAVAIARMWRVESEMALRAAIELERKQLAPPARMPLIDQYRDFLRTRAEGGDGLALAELRRMKGPSAARGPGQRIRQGVGQLEATGAATIRAEEEDALKALRRIQGWSLLVSRNGDVTYSQSGQDAVRDTGRTVDVFNHDDATIEAALRLARAKFGWCLKVGGDAEFEQRVMVIAGRIRVEVELPIRTFPLKSHEQNIHLNGTSRRTDGLGAER